MPRAQVLEGLSAPVSGFAPDLSAAGGGLAEIASAQQLWQPRRTSCDRNEDLTEAEPQEEYRRDWAPEDGPPDSDRQKPATRIMLRPHDPRTGEEVERDEVVNGYEYERGRFVTFTAEELKALDVEALQ